MQITTRQYLNISPITELENFNNVVGIFFLATPDMLLGLASWTFYDNNSDDAITAKFGSGCSSIFSEATLENSKNGKRTFIGLFDPSVRRYIHENILSFTIPMSRFREMYYTIQDSCLSNTPAWGKLENAFVGSEVYYKASDVQKFIKKRFSVTTLRKFETEHCTKKK